MRLLIFPELATLLKAKTEIGGKKVLHLSLQAKVPGHRESVLKIYFTFIFAHLLIYFGGHIVIEMVP